MRHVLGSSGLNVSVPSAVCPLGCLSPRLSVPLPSPPIHLLLSLFGSFLVPLTFKSSELSGPVARFKFCKAATARYFYWLLLLSQCRGPLLRCTVQCTRPPAVSARGLPSASDEFVRTCFTDLTRCSAACSGMQDRAGVGLVLLPGTSFG